MRCFNLVLVCFFLLLEATQAVNITNTDFSGIQTGSPFTITWTDASAPITIILLFGNSSNVRDLKVVKLLSADVTGTSYMWTPDPTLQSGPYRLGLADSAVKTIYSPLFSITNVGGNTASLTSTSSTSSSSFTTSTSASTTPQARSTETATSTTSSSPTQTPSVNPTNITDTGPTSPESRSHIKTAILAGIVVCALLFAALILYFAIPLLRNHCCRKKRAVQDNEAKSGNKVGGKDGDAQGGLVGAQMSGALDVPVGVSVRSNDSTMGESIADKVNEPEPVEIGSSGFGKEMSEAEKAGAVELEANETVRFEERKRRRMGVRVVIRRLKILL